MFANLKAEQARKKMTNKGVADVVGITRSAYENKLKSGRFYVSEIVTLCRHFNCNFEYLFAEDTQMDKKGA